MHKSSKNPLHPGVLEAQAQLMQGRISRREFLRLATLLGTGFASASLLAACGSPQSAAPPTAPAATPTPSPIRRGGTLRFGMKIPAADHPARLAWGEGRNVFSQLFEYLAETDAQNITHPHLLESWTASDDLTVWTLKLREGIRWSNGDELVAEHVLYNFTAWFDPDIGSSILGLWSGFLTLDGVEQVDRYTLRLNLLQPKLDVPENLYHTSAIIVHPSFDGDIASGANASTGPYRLAEYVEGERARLERRTDYWQIGADGDPLPYLDTVEFLSLGDDPTAYVAALQTGQLHTFYEPGPESIQALQSDERLKIYAVDTAKARVLRMRVDQEPFSDVRVRQAIRMVQDREAILEVAVFGEGLLGHDVHVAPVHPEFAPMELPAYDPEGAKALLAEAGYSDGLDLTLAVGAGWPDVVAYAESLQQTGQAAGLNIAIETMPNPAYWEIWAETSFGITPWTHRSLAVMQLALAYTADSEGKPGAWNETRWVDEEFSAILTEALGTIDVDARRVLMADLQRIMLERGPIGIAWWQRAWEVFNPAFQGIYAHPTLHSIYLRTAWYDPEQDPFV
ncbi:MAG: ABC transporter substrate-binding protein [Candidatus Viridilinea halotolerans]|uniref:ABC transporter substrate-binding protein n=1 Tax=Candidatus Viridilinea halotolerans TaxID=2491704 RepID=A0A426TSB0_9CHLR|nr:MAG: ABC transporter substrate-binding protein [Candidatus Viridilinea halotolerans]